jgi:hypothetical protein
MMRRRCRASPPRADRRVYSPSARRFTPAGFSFYHAQPIETWGIDLLMPSLSSSKQIYGYKSNNPDQINADCKCLDSARHEKASLTLSSAGCRRRVYPARAREDQAGRADHRSNSEMASRPGEGWRQDTDQEGQGAAWTTLRLNRKSIERLALSSKYLSSSESKRREHWITPADPLLAPHTAMPPVNNSRGSLLNAGLATIKSRPYASAALAVAIMLTASAVVNTQLAKKAERDNPPRGRFVEIDGVRLHYVRAGFWRRLGAAAWQWEHDPGFRIQRSYRLGGQDPSRYCL